MYSLHFFVSYETYMNQTKTYVHICVIISQIKNQIYVERKKISLFQ